MVTRLEKNFFEFLSEEIHKSSLKSVYHISLPNAKNPVSFLGETGKEFTERTR